jgi:hypothetical protein
MQVKTSTDPWFNGSDPWSEWVKPIGSASSQITKTAHLPLPTQATAPSQASRSAPTLPATVPTAIQDTLTNFDIRIRDFETKQAEREVKQSKELQQVKNEVAQIVIGQATTSTQLQQLQTNYTTLQSDAATRHSELLALLTTAQRTGPAKPSIIPAPTAPKTLQEVALPDDDDDSDGKDDEMSPLEPGAKILRSDASAAAKASAKLR